MERSRTARKQRSRSRKRQLLLIACGAVGCVAIVSIGILGARVIGQAQGAASEPPPPETLVGSAAATANGGGSLKTSALVEVPNVVGKVASEAELVLSYAGFDVVAKGETATVDGRSPIVVEQSPKAGTKLRQGEQVSLTCAMGGSSSRSRHYVVVLDPGHQDRADLSPEPVGPGAKDTKEKVTAGAVGVATGRSEAQVTLEIATRVKAALEARDIQVVMTRSANAVNLSNVARAQIANRAGADLLVRLHADSAGNPAVRGVNTLYPGGNSWVAPIGEKSKRAALALQSCVCSSTGAEDRGTTEYGDLAGFNWSRVPAVLIEVGFLSNADDDRQLAQSAYLDRVTSGLTNGIVEYLGSK